MIAQCGVLPENLIPITDRINDMADGFSNVATQVQTTKAGYCSSTIGLTKTTMYALFASAFENGIIVKNPVSKTVKCINAKETKPERVLTRNEQRTFLEFISGRGNYNQYALVLQTGLRAGELTGLKWSDIDFDKRMLHVARTADYRTDSGEWEIRNPKS